MNKTEVQNLYNIWRENHPNGVSFPSCSETCDECDYRRQELANELGVSEDDIRLIE
jgi:hypothetical protein